MNEFEETPNDPKSCEVYVGWDSLSNTPIYCGRETFLTLCNYDEPIAICKLHINRFRERANRTRNRRKVETINLPD